MKKLISLMFILLLLFSCSEDKNFQEVDKPTFKLTSFQKELIDEVYYCTATIEITNISKEYSIDGILYANDIITLKHNLPYNEIPNYNYYKINNEKYYFNLFGKHKGDIKLIIKWMSKEDKNNYLIGWHLTYNTNYEILIINLNTNIINLTEKI